MPKKFIVSYPDFADREIEAENEFEAVEKFVETLTLQERRILYENDVDYFSLGFNLTCKRSDRDG